MTVKESHPLPDETFDEWFNYMANTESGTTVFKYHSRSIIRLLISSYSLG
jgi:hypothetical protein